jgi:hypothetical protein|tara:strand:+ start:172 stop:441 length:270 start_codon:yes stop_codon:yes gene_type:complete
MKKYIIKTKSVMIEQSLVEANSKKEAFEKVLNGDILAGEGEGGEAVLLNIKTVTKKTNLKDYFIYSDLKEVLEDKYETIQNKFNNRVTI